MDFAAWEEVDQFVGAWKMKRPRESALCAGTVFGIRKRDGSWTREERAALEACLYGAAAKRAAEGFGQLRVWERRGKWGAWIERPEPRLSKPELIPEVRNVAAAIIWRYIKEAVRGCAKDDVDDKVNAAQLRGKKHLMTRLENQLDDWRTKKQQRKQFFETVRENFPMDKDAGIHLQGIRLGHQSLWDILVGEAALPYADRLDWRRKLPQGLPELVEEIGFALPGLADDEIFYEYWRWFFRHARKKAAGRESNDE